MQWIFSKMRLVHRHSPIEGANSSPLARCERGEGGRETGRGVPFLAPMTPRTKFDEALVRNLVWIPVLTLALGFATPSRGEAADGTAAATKSREAAREKRPRIVSPDDLRWFTAPGNPGLQGAWVIRTEKETGLYVLRVRIASNARIPPHTHPDERIVTVLAGTITVGFGEILDTSKAVAVPAGSVFLVPAGTPHFVIARDGDAVYQETGVGPTATEPVPVVPVPTR